MLFILLLPIMKHYELVCVIDSSIATVDIKDLIVRIEKQITSHDGVIVDTDDIWLIPTAYPLKGQDQAYIISYHITIDPAHLVAIKSQYSIEKGLEKFFFYGMSPNATFMRFADLQKQFEKVKEDDGVEEEDDDIDDDAE